VDTPAAEFDEQQDIERLKPGRLNGEEVAGDHPLSLRSAELSLARSGPPRGRTESRGPQQVADRGGRYVDPEPGEFALNAHATPAWVLARDPQNEITHLWIDRRTPRLPCLAVGPLPSHEVPVPAQECGWGDQKARPSLARDRPAGRGEEDPIDCSELWRAGLAPEDPKLMAKDEDLEWFALGILRIRSTLQPHRRCPVVPRTPDGLVVRAAKASASRRIIRPLVVGI
jgi:hypothetical protein